MNLFESAGLRPEILEAVAKLGFESPTPIQERTLELLQKPATDLIALAQTGTGKTAAFGLPLLQRINTESNEVQALILCPTRELCLQIVNDINSFSRFMKGVTITAVYGGASIDTQIRALRKGTQIVVGTPGRVVDMLSRGELRIRNLNFFVLDEADEMLNMGFKDDLETIFESTPKEKNTWLFSATMPSRVESIAGRFMNEPVKITMGKRNEGASNIEHIYYMVQARDRFEALSRIVAGHDDMYGVVFCRTRMETTDIAEKLSRKGYSAQAINGDLSQQQRDKVMGAFRKGHVRLLVATDVAARGLDIDELTHVVNYNLPDDPEVYVHRSGRTGRAGKSGICVSIIHSREQNRIRDLERMTGKTLQYRPVPLLSEIVKFNVLAMADKFLESKGNIAKMGAIPAAVYLKFEALSREELIELWIKWAHAQQESKEAGMPDDINVSKNDRGSSRGRESRDFESRGDRPGRRDRNERPEWKDRGDRGGDRGGDRPARGEWNDRGASREDRGARSYEKPAFRERAPRDADGAFTEVEINIGHDQYIKPNKIMGIINDITGNPSINFGRIDIFDRKTFVGVETAHAQEVAAALDGLQFGSTQLVAQVKQGGGGARSADDGGFKPRSKPGGGYPRGKSGDFKPRPSTGYKSKAGGFKKNKPSGGKKKY